MPVLASVVVVPVLAAALAALYGTGFVGYDTMFSLAWGEDIAGGELPDFERPAAPTPHPLAIVMGAILSPLGSMATLVAVELLALASLSLLAWTAFRLGRALFSTAVGVAFAAIMVTRPFVVGETLEAFVDVPFLALVLWAAALAAERPQQRLLPLALLSLAGLLRPEAWVLTAAYVAYLLVGRRGRRVPALLIALSAPALWALIDLIVTGDPLFSLHGTQELAEAIERPRGLGRALELTPPYLELVLGEPFVWGGLAGALAGLSLLYARSLLPAAMLALGLAAFLVLGIADLPLLRRYLLVPAAMLGLFCAVALLGWIGSCSGRSKFAWATGATLLAAWLATTIPGTLRDVDHASAELGRRGDAQRELHGLLTGEPAERVLEGCAPAAVPSVGLYPSMVLLRSERGRSVSVGARPPSRGVFVAPVSRAAERAFDVAPGAAESAEANGFRLAAANGWWALYERC